MLYLPRRQLKYQTPGLLTGVSVFVISICYHTAFISSKGTVMLLVTTLTFPDVARGCKGQGHLTTSGQHCGASQTFGNLYPRRECWCIYIGFTRNVGVLSIYGSPMWIIHTYMMLTLNKIILPLHCFNPIITYTLLIPLLYSSSTMCFILPVCHIIDEVWDTSNEEYCSNELCQLKIQVISHEELYLNSDFTRP